VFFFTSDALLVQYDQL